MKYETMIYNYRKTIIIWKHYHRRWSATTSCQFIPKPHHALNCAQCMMYDLLMHHVLLHWYVATQAPFVLCVSPANSGMSLLPGHDQYNNGVAIHNVFTCVVNRFLFARQCCFLFEYLQGFLQTIKDHLASNQSVLLFAQDVLLITNYQTTYFCLVISH